MRCLLVILVLAWSSIATAETIGVEIDVEIQPPPAPPSEPRPPDPPAHDHGWDRRVRFGLSATTAATAVIGTGERGRGFGGVATFHAAGTFMLDQSIEVLHQTLELRSITQINYAIHVVDRQRQGQRAHPFLVFAIGLGISIDDRDEAEVQGLVGIGAGVRFKLTDHIVPSLEVRALHRLADDEHGLPGENLTDVRAGVMYLF